MPACARCAAPSERGARFCSLCGAPLPSAASPAHARKVVTVLFCDVSGFTALAERLDPETLHQVLARWLERADQVIERHGGTVEKHMGDGLMAVFGVPVAHEDDALRGARAALEMRDALAELNHELGRRWGVELAVRTGLNTGEVVVGAERGREWSVLGDAVNVAQRLETAAEPGRVLIGEQTARLVRGAARIESVAALALKGKAKPVPAWRLLETLPAIAAAPLRRAPAFVGRERELETLRAAFDEVRACRTPRLVTVLGPAGIGKSRLARALLDGVGDQATCVVGRCLPYGESITYWPLTEIARRLVGSGGEPALAALVDEGAPASEEAQLVAARVAAVAGFGAGAAPVEEAQWAVRKLLEAVARRQPLVVAFEDIHWATPTLLDLIDHLATVAAEAPLLIVCLARPELLEQRPSWSEVAGERAQVLRLAPLSAGEAGELLQRLARALDLSPADRERLLANAEGNPFFLEQMVAMRAETRGSGQGVPPTIQAVLTARIDRLADGERRLLEGAAVEGRTFHRGALAELLPDAERGRLDADLAALAGRDLIAPASADLEAEQAFRFSHILIRDATYALIPKQRRALLHELHARWLERRAGRGLGEHAEVIGFHLEQAFGFRVAVEPAAREASLELAASGGRHLGVAGRAALARDDLPAAIELLERAAVLLPEDDGLRGSLLPELGIALTEAGRLSDAEVELRAAAREAASRGDAIAEAHAGVAGLFGRLQVDSQTSAAEVRERFDSLLATFEGAGDDLGLDRLWRLRALVHWVEARSEDADAAWQRAAEHARRAGDERGRADALAWLASCAYFGPTPVTQAIARCEEIRDQLRGDRRSQAIVLNTLAALWAMRGEFETARRLLAEASSILAELGPGMQSAVSHPAAMVALISGDAAAAEATLRAGYERLVEMGEKAFLSYTAALLARALCEQGRYDEAWDFTQRAQAAAADDDLSAQIGWRAERARVLVRRGAAAEAKRMAARAVRLAAQTDWLSVHADTLLSEAEVLDAAGGSESARAALSEAATLYERKGDLVGLERARSRLAVRTPA